VAAEAARAAGPVLLVGDFNTPPESAIFRRVWAGYADAFSDAGWGWGYTFWTRLAAVRIDHVLVGRGGRATSCRVGPDVGSPHRPVVADVAWPAGGAASGRPDRPAR
jgi:vancomycin resistance protein VanJ